MDPTPPAETAAPEEPIRAEQVRPGPQKYGIRYFLDSPWVMLLVLFGVTGALGLPGLWVSRGFNVWSKLLLSIVVIAYTALLVWIAWLSVHSVYLQIREVW